MTVYITYIIQIALLFVFLKNDCDYCHVLELLELLIPWNECEGHNFSDTSQCGYSESHCRGVASSSGIWWAKQNCLPAHYQLPTSHKHYPLCIFSYIFKYPSKKSLKTMITWRVQQYSHPLRGGSRRVDSSTSSLADRDFETKPGNIKLCLKNKIKINFAKCVSLTTFLATFQQSLDRNLSWGVSKTVHK